jgi:hypothetical protein
VKSWPDIGVSKAKTIRKESEELPIEEKNIEFSKSQKTSPCSVWDY